MVLVQLIFTTIAKFQLTSAEKWKICYKFSPTKLQNVVIIVMHKSQRINTAHTRYFSNNHLLSITILWYETPIAIMVCVCVCVCVCVYTYIHTHTPQLITKICWTEWILYNFIFRFCILIYKNCISSFKHKILALQFCIPICWGSIRNLNFDILLNNLFSCITFIYDYSSQGQRKL